jgi:two-component system cell cycle response regulator DivK
VLLIEDNSLLTSLYSAGLKKEGLEVVIVHNGEEGLRVIDEHCPDVVLLDSNMPGLSGIEVLERIRSNPKTKDLKVIILTISDKPEDKKRVQELGVSDYLMKTELHLNEIVKKVLLCLNC